MLDVLLAKVVTGAAGTVPTVTALANADKLTCRSFVEETIQRTSNVGCNVAAARTVDLALNWARSPRGYLANGLYYLTGSQTGSPMLIRYSGTTGDDTGTLTARIDRYIFRPVFYFGAAYANSLGVYHINTDYYVEA